jgi:hypothetical protein
MTLEWRDTKLLAHWVHRNVSTLKGRVNKVGPCIEQIKYHMLHFMK